MISTAITYLLDGLEEAQEREELRALLTAPSVAPEVRRQAGGEVLEEDEYVPSWWKGDAEAAQAATAFAVGAPKS